jgi:hypothetical protein
MTDDPHVIQVGYSLNIPSLEDYSRNQGKGLLSSLFREECDSEILFG